MASMQDTTTAPPSNITAAQIAAVRGAIDDNPDVPYMSGTCILPRDQYRLFYCVNKQDGAPAHCIDLKTASPAQLAGLSAACEPASFGLNGENVLDNSYRLARKMDTSQFATTIDIHRSGLLRIVETELVKNASVFPSSFIVPELYKLNVYETGGFFKAHRDTPHATNMVGSLVLVLPTVHQGGQLALRHNDQEWQYDSAAALSPIQGVEPKIGYVAFYSDVEHEVLPVTSGYRITLTYNLYLESAPADPLVDRSFSASKEDRVQFAVAQLMADISTTLPKGGYLGFGLAFKYPVEDGCDIGLFRNRLKGPDALIMRVCEKLNLDASVCAVYRDDDCAPGWMAMSPRAVNTDGFNQEYYEDYDFVVLEYLVRRHHARMLRVRGASRISDIYGGEMKWEHGSEDMVWVSGAKNAPQLKSAYVRYGNEATIAYVYGDLAVVVAVPAQTPPAA